MEAGPSKAAIANREEAFVQCANCHLIICKTEVLSETTDCYEVQTVTKMKVQYEYGECLFLCLNCEGVIGQVNNGKILLPKKAVRVSHIHYKDAQMLRMQPHRPTPKENYVQCFHEAEAFLETFRSKLDSSERRVAELQKQLSELVESPLMALLNVVGSINE